LAFAWHLCEAAASPESLPDLPQTRPPSIAVVPLANLTGDGALGWVGIGLQDRLSWEVQRLTRSRVLDFQELVQQAKQLPAALAGLTPDRLASLGSRLGVDVLIGGEYRGTGQQISCTLFAFDTARQTQIASRSFFGPLAQVVPQANQALLEIAQSLPIAFPPKGVQQPLRSGVPASSALAARANGLVAVAESLLGGGIEPLKKALGWFRQAVQGDPTDGEAWYRLGEALVRSAEYDEGRQALHRGLGVAQATGDRVLELVTLTMISESYLLQGRAPEAEPYFGQILPLARQSGDWVRQIAALHGYASVFHLRGETDRSKEYLERALALARATGSRGAEAKLLNHLGVLRISLGEYAVARQYLGEAVTLAQAIGDRNTERMGLNNLAVIAIRQGAYREARGMLEKVLQITRTLGDRRGEALSLKNIGQVEALRGAYATAFPILEEALSLTRMVGVPLIEFETLQVIGSAHFALGAYPEAQAAYEKGLGLARAHKVPGFEGLMLHYLGQVSLARMALDDAKRYEEGALAIAQQIVTPRVEVLALPGLAEVQFARGDYVASRGLFERALRVAQRLGHSETLWQIRYGLGRIHEVQGDHDAALAQYREAVTIISGLTSQFGEEEERLVFLSHRMAVYDALTRLLLKLHEQDSSKGYDREAWAVLEAKKGRVVGEALGAVRAKPADPQARAEAEKAQAKQDQVLALEKSLRNEQAKAPAEQRPERIQGLTTLLAQTKAEYLAQVKAFLARYPQYKSQFVDQYTVDPRTLAKFAEELPEKTLAVQYFAAPDALYLFVVAPGGRFQVKRQAVAQAELYGLIRQYRKYIERGATRPLGWADNGSEEYRRDVVPLKEVTRKLAAHLLAPIEAELQAYPSLILIPNDQLLYLPIHALTRTLPDGSERFLAETHAVSYLTQQEVVSLFKAPRPSATTPLLALANPDGSLPAASREVQELRRIRPAVTTLDGPQATKERFLSLAGQFPDLHLATHGILDPQRPERSYLLMAGEDEDSQRLGIDEIGGLSLHGMAILSACETALGEQVPGAALITLAAAFSQAGAHAIVASLWKVNDAATRDFMVAFYRALPAVGRAAALQQAQLAVLKNPLTANPHYWAPFILIGAR
jgi:CHAT domain-containing protein/TolB-like protein/Flp pilus assembly protein TadD